MYYGTVSFFVQYYLCCCLMSLAAWPAVLGTRRKNKIHSFIMICPLTGGSMHDVNLQWIATFMRTVQLLAWHRPRESDRTNQTIRTGLAWSVNYHIILSLVYTYRYIGSFSFYTRKGKRNCSDEHPSASGVLYTLPPSVYLALTSLLSLKTLPCSHDLYPLVFKQLCCTVFKAFMSIDQEKKGLSAPGPPSSTVAEEWVPASPNLSSKN